MIPREASRGRSFKGAGQYYLHDKDVLTSERVSFTHTENIPTQDPEKAMKWMAWTAIHATDLKRDSGAAMTGRHCERPVFSFSLSWAPEESPNKREMIRAGRLALLALGLQEHEAVMVAHRDRPHPHLHVITSVLNPETGRASSVRFSKKKLSLWAEDYERKHGKIFCRKRVTNNAIRADAKLKHEGAEVDLKAVIAELYRASDDGESFRAALAERGFELAMGKRIVVVDSSRKIHSLSRQLDGVRTKDLKLKLASLDLPGIEEVVASVSSKAKLVDSSKRQEKSKQPKQTESSPVYFDRDRQHIDWENSIVDAAIEFENSITEDMSPRFDGSPAQLLSVDREKTTGDAASEASGDRPPESKKPKSVPREPSARLLNRLQDRRLAELGEMYSRNTQDRLTLEATLDEQYGAHEHQLRREASHLQSILENSNGLRLWWLKVTGQISKSAKQDIQNMRRTLENIELRKSEARQGLEFDIGRRREALEMKINSSRDIRAPDRREASESQPNPESEEDFGPSLSY